MNFAACAQSLTALYRDAVVMQDRVRDVLLQQATAIRVTTTTTTRRRRKRGGPNNDDDDDQDDHNSEEEEEEDVPGDNVALMVNVNDLLNALGWRLLDPQERQQILSKASRCAERAVGEKEVEEAGQRRFRNRSACPQQVQQEERCDRDDDACGRSRSTPQNGALPHPIAASAASASENNTEHDITKDEDAQPSSSSTAAESPPASSTSPVPSSRTLSLDSFVSLHNEEDVITCDANHKATSTLTTPTATVTMGPSRKRPRSSSSGGCVSCCGGRHSLHDPCTSADEEDEEGEREQKADDDDDHDGDDEASLTTIYTQPLRVTGTTQDPLTTPTAHPSSTTISSSSRLGARRRSPSSRDQQQPLHRLMRSSLRL